ADVEEERGVVGDRGRAGASDRRLRLGVHQPALGIADIGHARPEHRAAVNPGELAGIGQFRPVAADRLQRDAEAFGEILDGDTSLGPREIEDFALTKAQGHHRLLMPPTPIRTFCHQKRTSANEKVDKTRTFARNEPAVAGGRAWFPKTFPNPPTTSSSSAAASTAWASRGMRRGGG